MNGFEPAESRADHNNVVRAVAFIRPDIGHHPRSGLQSKARRVSAAAPALEASCLARIANFAKVGRISLAGQAASISRFRSYAPLSAARATRTDESWGM
jgi:hypothetical protein